MDTDNKLIKLREDAELILNQSSFQAKEAPLVDLTRIIHDLKVYQIELELQNEELRNTQKQLEESRNRFAQLYNQAPAGYVTLNQNSIILQANQTFADLVNKDLNQILNTSLSDFLEEEDRSIFLSRFNAFFKRPADKSMELKLTRKGGTPFFVRITGNLKTDDLFEVHHEPKQPKLFLIINDITKQKIAEDLLKESEYSYRTLADSGQALIWSAGTDKLCNYFNNVWLNFTGRPLEMELGDGWMEGIHPADYEYCTKTYLSSFDKRETFTLEYRLRNSKGEYRWILDKATPNYNVKGEFIGYIGHCFDISEIKLAEERITFKNEELLKLNAEKDKFFSIIAHDLRSPFNSFLGLTQLMSEELPRLKISEIQYFATSLNRSASNLFGLLENLLEWSSLQRGIIGFAPVSFFLKPKISEMLQLAIESAYNKGIDFEIIVPDELMIFADVKMFESTIRNLVSNAVKFSSKGGKVTVCAKSFADDSIEISVQDTGIGMNKGLVERLFRIHQQTSRMGTEGEPSTGLGLILCKDFVEKHGGEIWAESEEGKGSRFCFTIPNYLGLQSRS
ncbi:MAG: PAS domain-containing sensor histidine kinase [Prolixibacteraceae bacterium]|nr:PAS domain-containing sensor histidine kinase [Prolixibacteraceae bacterium]